MYRSNFLLVLLLFFCCPLIYCNTAGEPVYTNKETLYSTKSGRPIGELSVSIEAKSTDRSNNEWYLIIGSKNSEILESKGENVSLWVFGRRISAVNLKKELKNKDYPVEIKDFNQFMPFCENGIRFELKDREEIKRQTQLSFHINASPGEKITLRLVFYLSSKDKKKTIIDDEAKLKIEFVVPGPSSGKAAATGSGSGNAKGNDGGGEEVLLTEKIDYEAAAKIKEEKEAEEKKQEQEQKEDRDKKISLVNSFIADRTVEINSLSDEVDLLLSDTKNKVEERKIDSLDIIAVELKKKVDYWENGYKDILLTDESIHDKFAKFSTSHSLTTKKLEDLRLQQDPLNKWLSFFKNNKLLSIGIAVGIIILGVVLAKLGKKILAFIKKSFTQMKNKRKTRKMMKKQLNEMEKMKENERLRKFESIDINELDEI